MNPRNVSMCGAAGVACIIAANAASQPLVDGSISGDQVFYGSPVALQQANVIDFLEFPTVDAEFALDNSNVAGKGDYNNPGSITELPFPCDPLGPADVTTGFELVVDLNELGYQAAFGDTIYLCAFLNGDGHSSLRNQITGGFGAGEDPDCLGEPRGLDFNTFNGDQFIAIDISSPVMGAATIDGTLDLIYGNPIWVNDIGTCIADNSDATADASNGGEFNAAYAFINVNNELHVFISGNTPNNYDKVEFFFDVASGGQNEILGAANPDIEFGSLQRMGNTDTESGLTFDSTFSPDYFITYNNGPNGTPTDHYLNAAQLLTAGGGAGLFVGGGDKTGLPVISGTGPAGIGNISITSDQSNICGVGGRIPGPGAGSDPDVSSPLLVDTGLEFKINLEGIGYDTSVFTGARGTPEDIRIGGFIIGTSWDFLSNNFIGGLTSFMGMPGTPANDPFNLGAPAKNTNLADWDGNQYADLTGIPGTLPDLTSSMTMDGEIDVTENGLYSILWINTTNAAGFGDNLGAGDPPMADQFEATGSEFNALYATVGLDNGVPTLFVMATGNLHDFNRMQFYFDVNPSLNAGTPEGQQDMRGDNPDVDGNNLNNGLGGPGGFQWDTDFYPDYMVSYAAGVNADDDPEHFAHGAHIFTDGGGYGGLFDQRLMSAGNVAGSIFSRVGLGDNADSDSDTADGSELNAAYFHVDTVGGFAYLLLTGNLESDFHKIDIFWDTLPGVGQNTLIADNPLTVENDGNPDIDFGALQRMGQLLSIDDTDPKNPILVVEEQGLTFDTDFAADFYHTITTGNFDSSSGTSEIYGNWARLGDGNLDPGEGRFLGQGITGGFGLLTGGDLEQQGIGFEVSEIDIDNSNTLGVVGGVDQYFATNTPNPPQNVDTGIELKFELADLNWNGTDEIKFVVFINEAGHDRISNQALAPVCTDEVGEPRQADFGDDAGLYPGKQYISYPTPTAAPPSCDPPPAGCDGDANGDGAVDSGDIGFVIFRLGDTGGACIDGDVNGDGSVDSGDISYVIFRLGTCNPGGPC